MISTGREVMTNSFFTRDIIFRVRTGVGNQVTKSVNCKRRTLSAEGTTTHKTAVS